MNNAKGRLGPGLDLKADGGYVVAPPSEHMSGQRYALSVDHHPDEVPLADAPDWLLATAPTLREPAAVSRPASFGREAIGWRQFFGSPIGEGRRNHEMTRLAVFCSAGGSIRTSAWTYCFPSTRPIAGLRCRVEIVCIVASISKREAANPDGGRHG